MCVQNGRRRSSWAGRETRSLCLSLMAPEGPEPCLCTLVVPAGTATFDDSASPYARNELTLNAPADGLFRLRDCNLNHLAYCSSTKRRAA